MKQTFLKSFGLGLMPVAYVAMNGGAVRAQDVPGIEICTVDKTMERRTSCLQSNVEFLVKTINKLRSDNDQKLDALSRQNAALRASVAELQKTLAETKAVKDPAKGAPAGKDAPAATKETPSK